ncbi:hypothetical protein [Nitratireductor thuwali]|uniref:Uncharacterized protein n=1 Tax=Nitratireductor thuwali TaxID=2267699 RepID=A0ABY5MN63_9HYPH|nr:hypothetical protein NTH_03342 [Nitratireductor thuwali]
MDEWQATSPEELRRLRKESARTFGDMLVCEAVRVILETGGEEAIGQLRRRLEGRITESPDHAPGDDRTHRLAFEELERAIQIARHGTTQLRGWTEDAPPSIEERKPGSS